MTTIVSIGAAVLYCVAYSWIMRRRHREAILTEYCNGFRDGVAYEAKAQVAQGQRALVRAGMSVN